MSDYDRIAELFHADRSRSFPHRRYVELAVENLPRGARVLDLGCGSGSPIAEHLDARGFRITGVDESERMLEIARRVVPEATLIQDRIETIDFAETFGAVIAWDSLFHVDRIHHAATYAKVRRWLAPGGRFLLSSGGSGAPGFTAEMHGHAFFYSSFEPEKVLGMLELARFHILLLEIDDPSSRGHVAILAEASE